VEAMGKAGKERIREAIDEEFTEVSEW